jgi:hypothetical protein
MKKIVVILLVAFIGGGFLFAETLGTDELTVYGMIPAGTKVFTVSQTSTDSVDLLDDLVGPSGAGHVLGNWSYVATNQSAESLTVTYTYGPLSDGAETDPVEIAYVLLEYAAGASTSGAPRNTTQTTGFTTTNGNYSTGRNIGFRLTNAGQTVALGAPDGGYQSTVTITLTNND